MSENNNTSRSAATDFKRAVGQLALTTSCACVAIMQMSIGNHGFAAFMVGLSVLNGVFATVNTVTGLGKVREMKNELGRGNSPAPKFGRG